MGPRKHNPKTEKKIKKKMPQIRNKGKKPIKDQQKSYGYKEWPKIHCLENQGDLLERWQSEKQQKLQSNRMEALSDPKGSGMPQIVCLEKKEDLLRRWEALCEAKKQHTTQDNNEASVWPKIACIEKKEDLFSRWEVACQAKKCQPIQDNNEASTHQIESDCDVSVCSSQQEFNCESNELEDEEEMYVDVSDFSTSSWPSSTLDPDVPIMETPPHFKVGSSVRRRLFSEDDN